MFAINWLFDKLGYIPKIKIDAGVVAAWPFPVETEKSKIQGKKKLVVKKVAVRKPKAK